jgi:hypothetical protein
MRVGVEPPDLHAQAPGNFIGFEQTVGFGGIGWRHTLRELLKAGRQGGVEPGQLHDCSSGLVWSQA